MGAFKSDAPIPSSMTTKSQNIFHKPVAIRVEEAPIVEEDLLTSSDESSAGGDHQPHEGHVQRLVPHTKV